MSEENNSTDQVVDTQQLDDMIAEADTGGRAPSGFPAKLLLAVPIAWSLFQLWYASPLPFALGIGVINDTIARSIHLSFAIFLAYLAFPALKSSPRHRIPIQDWVLAAVAAFCAGYLFMFYDQLADRPGAPITQDIIVGVIGIIVLLEATRRALGPPLMVVAGIFLLYTIGGPYMPEVISHQGASLSKLISHQWLGTEGVFGIALSVSTSTVFMFVLFGALLERAGAGNYFVQVAFSLLGHYRGGPAKAAVVSSGMTGLVSGSSIANVVTTGTFTIPLMKRVGFPAVKAGAVEVASSTNGQLTPPIMGAAAFLMIEFVGISYVEVIKHAFLPAVISYIALVYIVHLEALKADMKGLPRRVHSTLVQKLIGFIGTFAGLIILSGIVYYGLGWIKGVAGAATPYIAAVITVIVYGALVKYASKQDDLHLDDPNAPVVELPLPGPTIKSGLHYLLPVVVLVWCLTVERFSPGLSAFWATVFMIFIVITQRPLKAICRGESETAQALKNGFSDLIDGFANGARNMIGIGVATAAAGIIVGTVTQTGIGLVMTEFVEFISGGNLMLMLLFTAIICLVLGMGLPTTANYIVVSTLMAPVVVALGAQSGLIVPLIAVHMFVFYFGILADDTPPVGLAAFAAAAISGGDPIKTGLQGFAYDIRTAILPFMFIFNTELLLIGVDSWWHLLMTIVSAVIAMLVFAAGTQGYFLVKNRIWETIILILIAFTLFRPGFWMDMITQPYQNLPATDIEQIAEAQASGTDLRIQVEGETLDGDMVNKIVLLPLGDAGSGFDRLAFGGIEVREEDGKVFVDNIIFDSAAQKAGIDFDWQILGIQQESDRLAKQVMYIPALVVLAGIFLLQRSRRRKAETALA